jgi:PmbA protein
MEAILERARKVAEEAEVFFVSSEETPVHFEANRLKQIQSKQSTSVALRLVRQGRVGFAASNDPDDIENLVNMAVETSEFGMPARFQFPGLSSYPEVAVFDPEAERITLERMIGLGEELIAAITGHTPGIVCEAYVTRGLDSLRIVNSRGGEAHYRASTFALGVEGTVIQGTDMLFVGDGQSSCHPILETKPVTDLVINQLEMARVTATVGRKPLPVIFTPNGLASALTSPLMAAFNGKLVLEGASPLAGKLGEVLFDEKFSLTDDPTIAYRPHSRPCDDESVPSQRTPLIEKGTVANFFYDLQTAALAGTRSTGHGSRARGGLPGPAPSAFIIAPGETTLDEMIQDMREGLVIEQLMGAQQTNVLGGDFSGNVLLGYKVEVGKIVGRVKNTMVSGNIYQVLKDITAVGSQPRWVGGSLYTPALYCPRLSVASK